MAFALDITTTEIHDELHKIRKIRNALSHSKSRLSLDAEPMRTLFYQLKRPPKITGTFIQQFVECGVVIDKFLEAFLLRMGETEDLSILKKEASEEESLPSPP